MKIFFTVIISFFVISQPAFSHGLGQSLEKEVNGYIIDVGYDAIDKIEAGQATRFDFNLTNKEKNQNIDFDHVWVRISPKEGGIIFAGYLFHPEYLLTGMSFSFPKEGNYEVTVRFIDKDDKSIAETTFPLEIIPGERASGSSNTQLIYGALGLAAGFIAAWFLKPGKSVDKS
jgi:hypothetical protein